MARKIDKKTPPPAPPEIPEGAQVVELQWQQRMALIQKIAMDYHSQRNLLFACFALQNAEQSWIVELEQQEEGRPPSIIVGVALPNGTVAISMPHFTQELLEAAGVEVLTDMPDDIHVDDDHTFGILDKWFKREHLHA